MMHLKNLIKKILMFDFLMPVLLTRFKVTFFNL